MSGDNMPTTPRISTITTTDTTRHRRRCPAVDPPTPGAFEYSFDHAPLFFVAPSPQERAEFEDSFVPLVRMYWKMIRRTEGEVRHDCIVSERFPLTCGELAILSIKRRYQKRHGRR